MDIIQVLEPIYSNLKKKNIQIINSKILRKKAHFIYEYIDICIMITGYASEYLGE